MAPSVLLSPGMTTKYNIPPLCIVSEHKYNELDTYPCMFFPGVMSLGLPQGTYMLLNAGHDGRAF